MTDSDKPDDIKKSDDIVASLADEPTILLKTTADHSSKHENGGIHTGDLEPGTRINRIVIERLIGKGGMGAVYLAFDEKLQRQVALKSIRPEFLANPDTQQRFIREARILSKINHQSICHIYDYIELQGGDFLVLEYIKGQQLYRVSLDAVQTLDALIDLAEALDVAHNHGVIHRDLKPDNVMVSDSGQLKVLDFGIAQSMPSLQSKEDSQSSKLADSEVTSDLTQQGSLVGTIRYMSPEQARGEVLTTASDIYALGVMAQELFGKKPAYAVLETAALLRDVQTGRLLDCSALTQAQQHLVKRLTSKDASDRPDAKQTIELLKNIRQAPHIKKKKRIRAVLMTVAFIVMGLVLWQWQQFKVQQQQTERFNSFTSSINELVKVGEQIYALPIHNVRPEIEQLYIESAILFQKINVDDVLDDKQKSYLHGVIFLKSEEYNLATKKLQEGNASSGLLASAWIGLYIEQVSAYSDVHGYIQAIQSKEMQTKYLKPALNYVHLAAEEAAAAGLPQNNLHKAFGMAHALGMPAALSLLNEVIAEQKWNNELVKLKALLLGTMAMDYKEKGLWDAAHGALLDTASTYRQATEMARSFPYSYQGLCATEISLMVDALSRTSHNFNAHAQQAVEACEDFLLTQPVSVGAQNQLSLAHLLIASWQIVHGQPSQQAIDLAKSWNQKSRDNLKSAYGDKISAYIKIIEAAQLEAQGLPAQAPLNIALEVFKRGVSDEQPLTVHQAMDLLFVHNLLISQRLRNMEGFTDLFQKSEAYYTSGVNNKPLLLENQKELLVNMGHIYLHQLLYSKYQGIEIKDLAQGYLPFFQNSITALKQEPNALINYAHFQLMLAESVALSEVSAHVDIAAKMVNQALEINNKSQIILLAQAVVHNWQTALQSGPLEPVAQAFEAAVAVNPQWAQVYQYWAEAKLVEARYASTLKAKEKALQSAMNLIVMAISKDPLNQTFHKTQQVLQQKLESLAANET